MTYLEKKKCLLLIRTFKTFLTQKYEIRDTKVENKEKHTYTVQKQNGF
jgi:hypothetical protein